MDADDSFEEYKLSCDSIEEETDVPWFSLIQNLSHDQLQILEAKFKEKHVKNNSKTDAEEGLNKEEFLDVICELYDNHNYSVQSLILFDNISKGEKFRITWNNFLDFLISNLEPTSIEKIRLTLMQIEPSPQTKRDTIVKIVLIETKKYFCYVILSKYGKVGLYDGNLTYLTSYHVIMTREDIFRTEDERRRRNRWITDAVFCPDVLMFVVTNSTRSLLIYEASGLNHTPLWLILTAPYIVECMAYKCYKKNDPFRDKSVLFMGGSNGELLTFQFQQPKVGFFRKKHNDKLSIFYWAELPNEKDFMIMKTKGKQHKESIKHIKYYEDNNTIVTCSRDPNASVIISFYDMKRNSYCFKMPMGATNFALSRKLKLLITGSDDGIIRLWNSVIVSKPVSTLYGHYTGVVDLQILENQEIFFSCSRDGILKVWDINKNKCIQSLTIKFPSFKVQGKTIEWGIYCIYPGPKRKNLEEEQTDVEIDYSNFDLGDAEWKISSFVEDAKFEPDTWERSFILITCCNYIAKINLTFQDQDIKKTFSWPILQPPPLQNSVLIPANWAISNDISNGEEKEDFEHLTEINLENFDFILNKDLLEHNHEDINYKIACLERKKLEMQKFVVKGAPYLGLNLYDIKDLTISNRLALPTRKKTRHLVEKTKQLLIDSSKKDEIFSEPSSSRSKSSRSSLVEFPL